MKNAFSFSTTAKVLFGTPVSEALVEYVKGKFERVLIVTDKGVLSAGLVETTIAELTSAGIACDVFSEVEADPSNTTVMLASSLARDNQHQLIVGFGGGSSMDVAKLVSILANQASNDALVSMYGVDQIQSDRLPLILVPTTAGTGSEVTPIAIVTTGGTTKAGVVSLVLLPDLAILDPELTVGLPAPSTAATGIDAMVHAIEAFTSKIKKNPLSDMLAIKALGLLSGAIQTAVQQPQNIQARGDMLLGSMLAGQAFANAPVGGVHALAYPLGGHFHIPHGLSNSLVLPHVMQFNAPSVTEHYAQLASVILPDLKSSDSPQAKTDQLIGFFQNLPKELGLPVQLSQCGVKQTDLDMLATDAMLQQRLLINNPRELSVDDARSIYQQAF